ncbi:hypothetical protein [Streptomyces sp. NPDC059816]|uniref:hypothetical protein n=1 Tax=Streptomyces sp. NPDC059816 TaxID=3346960 RepID=UPI00365F0AFC
MSSTTEPGADPAPKPKRRTFSASYELRIVAAHDAAPAGDQRTTPTRPKPRGERGERAPARGSGREGRGTGGASS